MDKLPESEDSLVIRGFGDEWTRFDQSALPEHDRERMFDDYFSLFPWERLSATNSVGADIGCGSGRWAALVAPRVRTLHCIDASAAALEVARRNLADIPNVHFHLADLADLPLVDASLDFAFCLGVLHHVPDPPTVIHRIAAKLKRGAPLLVYLYYAFDTRPLWFRMLWRVSDSLRWAISRFPLPLRYAVSQLLACVIYWPLARTAAVLNRLGRLPKHWPLAYYSDKSFYVMRTDALDRFGTRVEQRFSQKEIGDMLRAGGFENIRFSDRPPYWCAVCLRR